MTHKPKRISDPAYAGYEMAINTSPMLNNPDSMRRLVGFSGLRPADAMRHLAHKNGEIKISKAEELKRKQEARLAELAELK